MRRREGIARSRSVGGKRGVAGAEQGVPSSSANGMDWAYSWSCASKGYRLAVSKLLARCWLLPRQFGTVVGLRVGKLGARLHRHQIARSAARTPSHAGSVLAEPMGDRTDGAAGNRSMRRRNRQNIAAPVVHSYCCTSGAFAATLFAALVLTDHVPEAVRSAGRGILRPIAWKALTQTA